jgi:23S rRNA (cytosine1962-C5)-methyltransferase
VFEPVHRPWLDARVIAHDGDVLVVDKPPGITVHGSDESRADDAVHRLRAWLAGRGQGDYLGVHQRLDKLASGVLLFTRSKEINAPVARDVEGRAAKSCYVAAVSGGPLPSSGVLEHQLAHGRDGIPRVVRRGGKSSRARFRVLAREADRALLELRPETGRSHQLRAQLAAAGCPVAGDSDHGGAPATRLMLHARELELPSLGRAFEAPLPASFERWVKSGVESLATGDELVHALADAGVLRWPLFEGSTAFRLCNGVGDQLPGVTVDRYGDYVVLALSTAEAVLRRDELASALVALGARGVYLKIRERADARRADLAEVAPAEPIAGEPADGDVRVVEDGIEFSVRLGDGLSTGLFVDQRENRARIRALAGGRRVLNLFSYTCAFSVAAALGGAREVVSVDLSGPALERGKAAFELNGLVPSVHVFSREDVLAWLRRAKRRGERFDLIVLDPPSFGTRGKRSTFDVATDFVSVAADCMSLLQPKGRLLAVTNHKKTGRNRFRKMLHEASRVASREISQLKDLPSPVDCPDGPMGPTGMKSALVTL